MQPVHVDGPTVRRLRAERLINRAELSRMSGVSYPFLCDIEKGRKGASDITAHKIARALGIPVEELRPPTGQAGAA